MGYGGLRKQIGSICRLSKRIISNCTEKRMRMESLKEIKTENKEKTTIKCFAYNEICQTSKFGPKKKEDKKVGPKIIANKASISIQETKECPC